MSRLKQQELYLLESSALLLIAAVGCLFVPNDTTAIALLVAALVNGGLSLLQDRQNGGTIRHLGRLLPARTRPSRSTLSLVHQKSHDLARRSIGLVLALEILLILTAWLTGLDATTTLIFGILLAVSLVPSGLVAELLILINYGTARAVTSNTLHAVRGAVADNTTQAMLVVLSVGGFIAFHVPAAVTAIQILVVNFMLQALPVAALAWDDTLRHSPKKSSAASRQAWLFCLTIATLSYGNFLLFFARHHVSPVYLDTTNFLYAEATSLVLLTLVFCQFTNLLLIRSSDHEKFFTKHLWLNKKVFLAFGFSLLVSALIIYTPGLKDFFKTGPLNLVDWLTALLTASLYLGLRLLQRHTNKHSRSIVLALHREATVHPSHR